MNALDIRAALSCGKQSCDCMRDRQTVTHCPVHGRDAHPSLSVQDGHSAPLVNCFYGCDRMAVIEVLKSRSLWPERGRPAGLSMRDPVVIHRYVDSTGRLVGEKGRFEWTAEDGTRRKSFKWRLPDSNTWAGLPEGHGVETMPLYNLRDLLARPFETVVFVEGEKAAEACKSRGLLAVTVAGSGGQRQFGDSLRPLEGRDLVLWPDNDDPGYAFMGILWRRFPGARWFKPAGSIGDDAFDFFKRGGSVGEVLASSDSGVRVERRGLFVA